MTAAGSIMKALFRDRSEAGRRLEVRLAHVRGAGAVVFGAPRGGVVVARVLASELGGELDVLCARELAAPARLDATLGAVAEGGVVVVDRVRAEMLGVGAAQLEALVAARCGDVEARGERLRRGQPARVLENRVVLYVLDLLTGADAARAALRSLRRRRPARVVLVAAAATGEAIAALAGEADEIVCGATLSGDELVAPFEDASTPTEDEIRATLDAARRATLAPASQTRCALGDRAVRIPAGDVTLEGDLAIPEGASSVVVVVHGRGSCRRSQRNQRIAEALRRAGFATLLFDLLTADEAALEAGDPHLRFDALLLAHRVISVAEWVLQADATRGLRVGYLGASTGAAASLVAAALRPELVDAVVSRGGRTELAAPWLEDVRAPTLLLVGGVDATTLVSNRAASSALRCDHALAIVRDAGHLFDEPGALERVAAQAAGWFARHLSPRATLASA